jgi:hypothetical protein
VSATATVNSFARLTVSEHGVLHVAPVESLASAPGGFDSIDSEAVVGLDEKKSMLGIENEQAASVNPVATTPTMRAAKLLPCLPFTR